MANRRLGRVTVRRLATSSSLESAVAILVRTPYGHKVRIGQNLAAAQRAVVEAALWNVRVLAGWAPREGVAIVRVLAGGLEAANIGDHLRALEGTPVPPPYTLGGLATAWPRLARTASREELGRVLAASAWGDPGGGPPRDVGLMLQTSLADRVIAAVPAAAPWAAGATALLVAREVVRGRRSLPAPARVAAARVIGEAALTAVGLPELERSLPAHARWALAGVRDASDLWQAEGRWWTRVERDGFALARSAAMGSDVLVGAVALMAVDAWRVRAALELAARGGGPLEAFDAVA